MSMRNTGPRAAAAAAGLAMALAACSGGSSGAGPAASPARHPAPGRASTAAAFGWFHPGPAPGGWRHARLPGQGAVLSYPASLRPMAGDRGTVTRGLAAPGGAVLVYLNVTPRQGDETARDWAGFRLAHLREDGQHAVGLDATSPLLGFRGGRGRCVIDHYRTSTNSQYREIACYVRARHGASVLVAATPAGRWGTYAGVLERAVSSYVGG